MTSSVRPFRDLVQDAFDGRLKLPAFQRNWKWKTDKVIKLFDSLRQRYPVGALLFLKGENEQLGPKEFQGSKVASGATADYLVLDGQQRLTAGIHLFHASGSRQYYLDLARLEELISDRNVLLTDKLSVQNFVRELDDSDGYLQARPAISDPRSLLIKRKLLCTSILADSTELGVSLASYVKAYPGQEDLAYRVIQAHFNLAQTDSIPIIEIDAATQIEAISRIFTTLNTTGQLLTPFELVVSILYPKKIDLSKDIGELRASSTYYPNMDKTGEILLQTIAMFGGVDPKKTNLPKNITADLYSAHKEAAHAALEELGLFLTKNLGAGLDFNGVDLVPYDAIFAPMSVALYRINKLSLKSADRIQAEKKLSRWYVGAALSQRYQEGVHNKQVRDFTDFMEWIESEVEPTWLTETPVPLLLRHSPDGAIGKLIRALINSRVPRDPETKNLVGFGTSTHQTEKHHIFPLKYVPGIEGWKKNDSANVILNVMFLESATNKRWINGNPADHLASAIKHHGPLVVKELYAGQLISDEAFAVLAMPTKSKKEFDEFLSARQKTVQQLISTTFGFAISSNVEVGDEEIED